MIMGSFACRAKAANTIEWLTARADVVVSGTVEEVRPAEFPLGDPRFFLNYIVEVRVTRTLKGSERQHATFSMDRRQHFDANALQRRGGEYLFFLLQGIDIPTGSKDSKDWGLLRLRDPKADIISLDPLSAQPCYSCTFRPLTTVAEIIEAARDLRRPYTLPRDIAIRVPRNSPVFPVLQRSGGGDTALLVPDDDRWKLPFVRYQALDRRGLASISLLARHEELKLPETIALVKTFLDDPDWYPRHPANGRWNALLPWFETRVYPRGDGAYALLRAWGQEVAPPAPGGPALPGRPFPRGIFFAPLLIVPFLFFPRRVHFPNRVLNLLTGISLALAVFALYLEIRSRSHYDDILFATPRSQFEFSSCYGKFQFLKVVDHPPEPYDALLRSAPLADARMVPDHIGCLYPRQTWSGWGIENISGVTPRDSVMIGGRGWPYRLVSISYAGLIVLFAILPWLRMANRLRRQGVRYVRRGRGLCPQCGYDLRASPSGCPECGDQMR